MLGNFHAPRESFKMINGCVPGQAWNAEDHANLSGKDLSFGETKTTISTF